MPGAQFIPRLAAGGKANLQAVLTNAAASVASGTFTVPSQRSLIVLGFAEQSSTSGVSSGGIIGGHAATLLVQHGSGTFSCLWAAMVDPGDPNTWSLTVPAIFSGRSMAYHYRIDGATAINLTASAAGITGTLNVAAGSTYLGIAKGQGPSSPPISWTLLVEDREDDFSLQSYSVAHLNYVAAATSQTATATLSGSVANTGCLAVLSP